MSQAHAEAASGTGRGPLARAWGALRLDASVFAEVARDPRALAQAAALVGIGGLARGLGAFPQEGWIGLLGSPVVAVLVWLVGGLLIWGIGARMGQAPDLPELLRSLGFAATPFALLPVAALAPPPWVAVWWALVHAWGTLALAIAVREAFGIPTGKALVICLVALFSTLALLFVAGLVLVGGSVAR